MKNFNVMCRCLILLTVSLFFSGCSLFKFSFDTGDVPVNPKEMKVRIMTRSFYYDFTQKMALTADSIMENLEDPAMKLRTIEWKIGGSKAMVNATMQSYPEVALIDAWLATLRMKIALDDMPDAQLFGAESDRARRFMSVMLDQIQDLAQSTLPAYRYNYAKQFIAEHIAAHPVSGLAVNAVNTAFEWDEFLKQYGDQGSFPIGTISEVSADLGDKVNGQVYNISHSLSWTKDMVEMKLEQDSTYAKLMLQLDTLEADFKRLVVVVEYVPEIADYIMKQLTERINEVLGALNSTVDNAFYRVNYQREALQDYVTLQSDSLVAQAQRAADAAVDNALKKIPGLIGEVLLYIVLFFLVMLSVPFVLGYLLGKARRKNKKKGGMASDDDGPDAV